MPVADAAEARDLVMTVLSTAWAAAPGSPPMVYQDQRMEKPNAAPYAEAEIQHMDGFNAAIGDSGRKRVRSKARLVVAIYTKPGDGLTVSDTLAKIVQNAFESKRNTGPDTVTFRRVRGPFEDGLTGNGYKVRVIVDFEYDRIQTMT